MQKRTILMLISSIVMLLLTTVTFVFAWFTIVEKTQKIIISSGKIKTEYELRKENQAGDQITTKLKFENVVPGDQFNYFLKITNKGNIDANLKIEFQLSGKSEIIKKAFQLIYGNNSGDFTGNRLIELEPTLVIKPNDDYILNFSVVFDYNYNGNSDNESVSIDKIIITLSQIDPKRLEV